MCAMTSSCEKSSINKHITAFPLIIIALLLWSGCYENVRITKDKVSQLDGYQDITVIVDSSANNLVYHFAGGRYGVAHDTLVGMGTTITTAGEEAENVISIPVSKIAYVETERIDLLRTALVAGTAIVATTLIIFSTSPSAGAGGSGGSGPHQGR